MSIKKKFVTAVATAGLLAGLFGSAFVPSALASHEIDTYESFALVANPVEGAGGQGIGVSSNYADGSLYDYGDSYQPDQPLPERLQISSYVDYGAKGPGWRGGTGDGSGLKRTGPTGLTYGNDYSIGFVLVDDHGAGITSADLSATVTGGKIKVAFAYVVNGGGLKNCSNSNLRAEFKSTGDSVLDASSPYGNVYFLCIRAVSKTTLGTSGLTIKADGVTIWSGTVQVIGDVDSMVLSVKNGYNRVADDNDGYGQFFKVIVKDAAGQAIMGTQDGFTNDTENQELFGDTHLQPSERGIHADLFSSTWWDGGINPGTNGRGVRLTGDACDENNADAGDTLLGALETYNFEGDRVTSNSVSIVCTGASDEYVIASVSQEYSSPLLLGAADWADSAQGAADATEQIDIYVVLKDGDGAFMGVDGSTGTAFDGDIDGNDGLDIQYGIRGAEIGAIGAGGRQLIGGYAPNMEVAAKFKIVVTLDPELPSEVVVNLFYQVSSIDSEFTLTRVRNGAKTVATWTADWGLDCSNALVEFEWVNKNGTKGTYINGSMPVVRRANFDGVATFTLARRNTVIFVTAYACVDGTSDVLGPVKARFR